MEKVFQTLIISFIILFVVCVIPVSGIQTFPQNTDVRLCHAVRTDGGLDSNLECNVTVYYSNGTVLVDFLQMDDYGDRFCYNLTSENHTNIKGIYDYDLTCTNGSLSDTESFQYLVNLGGIEPSDQRTETTSRTIYVFFGLAILTFIALLFINKFPVKVSLFLLMIWFLLMGINASYISIQDEVLNTNIENFFSFFLTLSFYANYFIFLSIIIIWMITFIISILDFKKKKRRKIYGEFE